MNQGIKSYYSACTPFVAFGNQVNHSIPLIKINQVNPLILLIKIIYALSSTSAATPISLSLDFVPPPLSAKFIVPPKN